MGGDRSTRGLLGLAALVALLALAGCQGVPPPEFCEDCEGYVSGAVEDESGIEPRRTELAVRVDPDGTTTYRLRTTLEPADAERFRENPERLDRVAAEVREEYPDATPSVGVEGDAVVVTHEGPKLGHRGVGRVVLVDRFYDTEDDRGLRLGVDRLTIRGPPGWVVTEAPDDATVTDGAVVYTRGSNYSTSISDRSLVAFAPDRSPASFAATRATLGLEIGGDVALQGGIAAGPSVVGLAAVVGLLLSLGVAMGDRIPLRRLAAVAAAAVVVLLCALVGGVVLVGGSTGSLLDLVAGLLASPVAVGVGLALVAAAVGVLIGPFYLDRESVAPLVVHGGRALAGATLFVIGVFVVAGVAEPVVIVLGLVAPTVLFFPLGYAIGVDAPDRVLHAVAITVAPVGVVLPFVPGDAWFSLVFGLVGLPIWAIGTALVGFVLFSSGYAVAVDVDPSDLGLPELGGSGTESG